MGTIGRDTAALAREDWTGRKEPLPVRMIAEADRSAAQANSCWACSRAAHTPFQAVSSMATAPTRAEPSWKPLNVNTFQLGEVSSHRGPQWAESTVAYDSGTTAPPGSC